MSLERLDNDFEGPSPLCEEFEGDLAVGGKLGVGVHCGWEAPGKTAYIHGTLQVKDRADVGILAFNSTYPTLKADPKTSAQLTVHGSLLLSAAPADVLHLGAARIVVDGKPEQSGADIVPLQIWRNSNRIALGVMDAEGQLGLGTVKPASLLHVAGDTRVDGSLAIGSPTFENRLTIQGGFGHQIPGVFAGKANLFEITGDNSSQLKVGDVLRVVIDGKPVLTAEKKDFFQVRSVKSDGKSFVVTESPAKDFSGSGLVYVDQSALVLKNGVGTQILSVDRHGNLSTPGKLSMDSMVVHDFLTAKDTTVSGTLTITGSLKGTAIVGSQQIADQSITLEKLSANLMKSSDGMLTINPGAGFAKGVTLDGPRLLIKGRVGVNLANDAINAEQQMIIENTSSHLMLFRRPAPNAGKAVFLELFQPKELPGTAYPSIRFHQASAYWIRIEAQPTGFYFKHGDLTIDDLIPIWASKVNATELEIEGVTIGARELRVLKDITTNKT